FLSPPVQVAPPPAPARTTATSWPTYNPGMMPRGKLISMDDAPQLADLGIGNQRLYVNGRFVVTAASDGRAVLRPVGYNGALTGTTIRMVVEYPAGARVPAEGSQVARGILRPFQIIDIRRGNDGQVNVYAREVTVPENQAINNSTNSPYYRNRYVQQNSGGVD
ncbi:MAG TPA: hypothetical protein VG733_08980, partial [Chthoniobacteraceae bacterium]|nr:hypothetical protein [Chthoniobacteraceae bacterium]